MYLTSPGYIKQQFISIKNYISPILFIPTKFDLTADDAKTLQNIVINWKITASNDIGSNNFISSDS